ncbi:protein-S-isoprenylcysteine O-methyltransferase [Lepeophtheirus salmonis]|uniref:protein-S-isoprenylcysteine O-methyltransferase n=1 Tax=Lepeophtheirus salmonis TaxID=72036 RepID=UPI001AE63830|nr:protein-S-isoprenylcysteine O-methyltransferase-like [Lepeophtheirus salmonis]
MSLVREGWISLYGFGIGSSILLFHLFSRSNFFYLYLFICVSHLLGSCFLIPKFLSLQSINREIFQIGTFLGWGCSIGIISLLNYSSNFGMYLIFLTLFHYSEYMVTAISNPKNISIDSYLINHGKEYGIALFASWLEYFIEYYFFGKTFNYLSCLGVFLCLTGDITRKVAMLQAGASFNHIVQNDRKGDHTLITTGLYSISRHPSYVGWFIWSTGTQIILMNPICLIGYIIVTWCFFNQRIYYEEYTLLTFFGESYAEYMDTVPVGIPFIQGFRTK